MVMNNPLVLLLLLAVNLKKAYVLIIICRNCKQSRRLLVSFHLNNWTLLSKIRVILLKAYNWAYNSSYSSNHMSYLIIEYTITSPLISPASKRLGSLGTN